MRLLLSLCFFFAACKGAPKGDSGLLESVPTDLDGDGYDTPEDCDDNNPLINPDVEEKCDIADNDCDGLIDEGVTDQFHPDVDGDGFGDPLSAFEGCTAPDGSTPAGYSTTSDDCDDNDASIHPAADESCDELDNDCDDNIDEGDGVQSTFYADEDGDEYGDPNNEVLACGLREGIVEDHTDCDDTEASVYPGAPEICDGLVNPCEGDIAEGGGRVSWNSALDGSAEWEDFSSFFLGEPGSPEPWTSESSGRLCFGSGTFYTYIVASHNLTVEGSPSGGSVISAEGVDHVLKAVEPNLNIEVSNITLTTGDPAPDSDCRFAGRYPSGGGICCVGAGSMLSLANAQVHTNTGQFGGGIFVDQCNLNVSGGQIYNNNADFGGGGLAVIAATAELNSVTVGGALESERNLSGIWGGGIFIQDYGGSASLTLNVCDVLGNSADDDGGGMYALNAQASLNIFCESSNFLGNTSTTSGGGIFLDGNPSLTVTSCGFGASESEDNSPDDVAGDSFSEDGYGDAESFTCDETGCR